MKYLLFLTVIFARFVSSNEWRKERFDKSHRWYAIWSKSLKLTVQFVAQIIYKSHIWKQKHKTLSSRFNRRRRISRHPIVFQYVAVLEILESIRAIVMVYRVLVRSITERSALVIIWSILLKLYKFQIRIKTLHENQKSRCQ